MSQPLLRLLLGQGRRIFTAAGHLQTPRAVTSEAAKSFAHASWRFQCSCQGKTVALFAENWRLEPRGLVSSLSQEDCRQHLQQAPVTFAAQELLPKSSFHSFPASHVCYHRPSSSVRDSSCTCSTAVTASSASQLPSGLQDGPHFANTTPSRLSTNLSSSPISTPLRGISLSSCTSPFYSSLSSRSSPSYVRSIQRHSSNTNPTDSSRKSIAKNSVLSENSPAILSHIPSSCGISGSPLTKSNSRPSSLLLLPMRTYYDGVNKSSSSRNQPGGPESADSSLPPLPPVLYSGAYSSTLRSVKLLSVTTCLLSMSLGPFVTFFTAPLGMSVIAKGTLASLMVILSASTTAGLHWFTSPYVHKLTWTPGERHVDVEILSWMATPIQREVRFADVQVAETARPLVTFEAEKNFYYIDKDAFPNAELLKKLNPEERMAEEHR
eukprot:TRINITY_DN15843_c0_g1_i1.p1 TRINITY_DN15843_c0_g1~~TRINITY_DN15843_c0_g1_i1.p1  ORF type:complete len:437 (+),score=34.65 TRINITY_DN15843_c0_g1_i1:261-1571(+)